MKDRTLLNGLDFVAEPEAFAKLWKAWRPDDALPAIDFEKEIALVGASPGSAAWVTSYLDEDGDLKVYTTGPGGEGEGFRYTICTVSRLGIKTVNGKALAKE